MLSKRIPPPEDCPICGKKEGAIMASGEFRHNIACCSRDCGHAIEKKIVANTETSEYKKAQRQYRKLTEKLYDLKYNGIDADDHFARFM